MDYKAINLNITIGEWEEAIKSEEGMYDLIKEIEERIIFEKMQFAIMNRKNIDNTK